MAWARAVWLLWVVWVVGLQARVEDSLDVETSMVALAELDNGLELRLPAEWRVPTARARQKLGLYHRISPSFSFGDRWDPRSFLNDPKKFRTMAGEDPSLPAAFLHDRLLALFGNQSLPNPSELSPPELDGLLAFLILEMAHTEENDRPPWSGGSLFASVNILTSHRAFVLQFGCPRTVTKLPQLANT
jgi:hypothetical protein